jgi:DNA-binding CsgD family transcriptional regulator
MGAPLSADLTRRRRGDLLWSVERADSTNDVLRTASSRLGDLVPFDVAVWVGTDPATGLPNGPTLLDGLTGVTAAQCSEHWRRELLGGDVNLFADLARRPEPAAALRTAAGDPRLSRRFRTFLQPLGYDDELRAVLRAGDVTWGVIALLRREGGQPFTTRDTRLVAGLSEPLGAALRSRARGEGTQRAPRDQPGVFVFSPAGDLVSANDHAAAWLAEIPHDHTVPSELGIDVPLWLSITAHQVVAGVAADTGDTARSRIRASDGSWLTCHATALRAADRSCREIVVVIEPARPAEIAPLVIDAYDLTDREQQITALIARGATTSEIADELYLSQHTVRGHVKAIFRKLRVTSRGELVAKLFAEHYEPAHHAGVTYASA